MNFIRGIIDPSCQHPDCRKESLPGFYRYYCEIHQCPTEDCSNSKEMGSVACSTCLCQVDNCESLVPQKGKLYCVDHLCRECNHGLRMTDYLYCKRCICLSDGCSKIRINYKFCQSHTCPNCQTNQKSSEEKVCLQILTGSR